MFAHDIITAWNILSNQCDVMKWIEMDYFYSIDWISSSSAFNNHR